MFNELKHLGPLGIQYLTSLHKLSFQQATLPAIWKHALNLILLKPGKPKDQGSLYRPISILCPVSKILVKLNLCRMAPHLTLADAQHGFRTGRLTTTALLPLVQHAAAGFNQKYPHGRTLIMAVDFSKAFDTVDHVVLINCLLDSTLDSNPFILIWRICGDALHHAATVGRCRLEYISGRGPTRVGPSTSIFQLLCRHLHANCRTEHIVRKRLHGFCDRPAVRESRCPPHPSRRRRRCVV